MKIFNKIKNAKVNCTHLVKKNDDGSYDVTKVMLLGQVIGCVTTLATLTICRILNKTK